MNSRKSIFVTGAAGYIGSHTCLSLLEAGYDVVALDNFSNSDGKALAQIEHIAQRSMQFNEGDIRDTALLRRIFKQNQIDAVIHFAGLKAVGESVLKPLNYFQNNVAGSVNLLEAMAEAGVYQIVFSSSATVYGDPESVPIPESACLRVTNPYGRSKLMVEQILADLQHSNRKWRTAVLRYFNPVGAHPSGLIGENPKGIPNNLMPFIAQVAAGILPQLTVFGDDYPTVDGTGVRDYIHVMDLAQGHIAALRHLSEFPGGFTVNLGTGQGHSVLEMIKVFEVASGLQIPYEIASRRTGDIATCFADPEYAHRLLGWRAQKTLAEMCSDHWRWQSNCAPLAIGSATNSGD
jgi:UDP-glucose 4-epimerase